MTSRPAALASLALLLAAGCTEPARSLPADRSARIVYVALGDSTVASGAPPPPTSSPASCPGPSASDRTS